MWRGRWPCVLLLCGAWACDEQAAGDGSPGVTTTNYANYAPGRGNADSVSDAGASALTSGLRAGDAGVTDSRSTTPATGTESQGTSDGGDPEHEPEHQGDTNSMNGGNESIDVLEVNVWTDADRGEMDAQSCKTHADCDDGNVCNGAERCIEEACVSGQALPNGEVCTGSADDWYVCRDGNCLKSRCGDGIVDERALEVCDDGNGERNDGCYDCRHSCETDADCNDSNICNGAERCDPATHTCVAGQPLADGTTCGPDYACWGARCVSTGCGNAFVDSNEECDDGNLEAGDGCGVDCRFECKHDADCDDGNVCNGEETCDLESHVCVRAEPLNCDDGNPCTEDVCDEVLGCIPRLIDVDGDGHAPSTLGECGTDCDDEDPEVFTGAGELCDGKDNNCDGRIDEAAPVWYPDCDGDGFAAGDAVGVQRCEKPSVRAGTCGAGLIGGWTSRSPVESADCWDADPDVYPGQEQSRKTQITGVSGAALPFDYNCDGTQEKRWTNVQTPRSLCILFLSSGQLCGGPSGWKGAKVPECGESAPFTFCDGCVSRLEQRVQECR